MTKARRAKDAIRIEQALLSQRPARALRLLSSYIEYVDARVDDLEAKVEELISPKRSRRSR